MKSVGGFGVTGFMGMRTQGSGSRLDGKAFVGKATEEAKALNKAFKGQGDRTKVLTETPSGIQILRHNQTGLFNLSSFQKVKYDGLLPPRDLPPPPPNAENGPPQLLLEDEPPLANVPDVPLLIVEDDPPPQDPQKAPLEAAYDRLREIDDALFVRDRGMPRSDRRDVIEGSRLAQTAATNFRELHALERELRRQPPSEQGDADLDLIRSLKQRTMEMAVRVELPGFTADETTDRSLHDLAARLVALQDKLVSAGRAGDPSLGDAGFTTERLLRTLADHGRIRELAQSKVATEQAGGLDAMTQLAETILQAVAPGRDGIELNSLMGRDVALDGALKQLRFVAVSDVLANDLARTQGIAVDQLAPQDLKRIGETARDLVKLDGEVAQCHRQLGRAMQARGLDGLSGDALLGVRTDTGLIKGLRETYGAEARKVGVILAALKEVEQVALKSEGAQGLRAALQRELEQKQQDRALVEDELAGVRDQMANLPLQMDYWFERIEQDDDVREIGERALDTESDDGDVERSDDPIIIESSSDHDIASDDIEDSGASDDDGGVSPRAEYQRLVRERELLFEQLEPLTRLDSEIRHLSQRIDSLTPEVEMIARRLGEARQALEEIGLDADPTRRAMAENVVTVWETRLREVGSYGRVHDKVEGAKLEVEQAGLALKQAEDDLATLERELELIADQNPHLRVEIYEDAAPELRVLAQRVADAATGLASAEQRLSLWQAELERSLEEVEGNPNIGGGFSREELKQLGLEGKEPSEILQTARRLARHGFAHAGEVSKVCSQINGVVQRLGAPGTPIEEGLQKQVSILEARDNESRARDLGTSLLGSLTGATDIVLGSGDVGDRVRDKLAGPQGRLFGLFDRLVRSALDDPLAKLGKAYDTAEDDMLQLAQESGEVVQRRQDARTLLGGFQGRRMNLDRPEGLSLSRALLTASYFAQQCNGHPEALPPEDRYFLDRALKQLRGFDPTAMTVPFLQIGARPPTMDQLAQWSGQQGGPLDLAKAIVFLREDEPEHNGRLCRGVAKLDRLVDARFKEMGADGEVLRDTIRAAILHTLQATGGKVDSFQPSDHVLQIKNTLRDWGVPVDLLLPEINRTVSESFGPDELELWRRTTTLSPDYRAALQTEEEQALQAFKEGNQSDRFDAQTAKMLYDAIDTLQSGTKVQVMVGDRVEVSTATVDFPKTPIGVNLRVMGSSAHGLEIRRSSQDGYELVIRQGGEARLGADLYAGGALGTGLLGGISLQGTATVETSGYRVTGVALRFPNNELGRENMKQTLRNILTHNQMTAGDLSSVENIMPVVETRIGVRAGLGGQASLKGSQEPSNLVPYLPSVQLQTGISGSETLRDYKAQNTNLTVTKTDSQRQLDITLLDFNIYLSTGSDHGLHHPVGGGALDPNVLGVDFHAGLSTLTRTKTKQTRGIDGLVTSSTNLERQMTVPLGWKLRTPEQRMGVVKAMGGPALDEMLKRLPKEQLEEVERIVAIAGGSDVINVVLGLDERVRERINGLLGEAKAIRAGRIPSSSLEQAETRARELEAQAQRMLDDPANYNAEKLQLIPTQDNQLAWTFNLLIARYERYVQDKSEWVALGMNFDAQLGRDIRDGLTEA